MDPGYKKIIPSQARGLGGAISPPVGSPNTAPLPLEARNNTVLVFNLLFAEYK